MIISDDASAFYTWYTFSEVACVYYALYKRIRKPGSLRFQDLRAMWWQLDSNQRTQFATGIRARRRGGLPDPFAHWTFACLHPPPAAGSDLPSMCSHLAWPQVRSTAVITRTNVRNRYSRDCPQGRSLLIGWERNRWNFRHRRSSIPFPRRCVHISHDRRSGAQRW